MDYKETLLLPKTSFPMRGNLVQNEPKKYQSWLDEDIYNKMKTKREGCESFTFHDGPPYANGHIHIGHVLNKTLKDIVVKYHYFRGKSVRFTPGWDCHGLPIEQQVEKKLGREKKEALEKPKLRELCRNHAAKFVQIQKEGFQSLGVIADWDKPYVTMDFAFEANIYRELCTIASKGLLKERKKPVYWSWAAKTALAEAEVEYEDKEDYSIYIAFPLNDEAKSKLGIDGKVVIWTTTPWTIPANVAISMNPEENYVLTTDGLIVAQARFDELKETEVLKGDIAKIIPAKELEGLHAINPLNGRDSKLILGEHVMMDGGSGCVHTAPGHGEDDYAVGLKYDLEVVMPVDDEGKYDETVVRLGLFKDPENWVGRHIFKANDDIVDVLGDAVVHVNKFTHSYPFCWRTHKPVIYRATKQWFIVMDEPYTADGKTLREVALGEVEKVKFYPESGHNRLKSMVENRPDWCISRQRDWGVPIAFFKNRKTGEVIFDEPVLNYIAMIFEKEGCDAWYSRPISELLYPGSGYNAEDLEKTNDILDVWFDSGSTQYAVLKSGQYDAGDNPADLYLEGSDQHRGWFQSSLLIGCATNEHAPYKNIITHGFTMDEKGEKMSKSKGNTVDPEVVRKKYGSEILRLWVAMSDYQNDQRISDNILGQISDQYRKLRNTSRFLLANIEDLETPMDIKDLGELDKWILSRAKEIFDEAEVSFAKYDFAKVLHKINSFLVVELSGIYLDLCKDRLYCDALNSEHRRSSQSAVYYIAKSLLGLIAPVLTYTANEIVEHAPKVLKGDKESIFDFLYEPIGEVSSSIDGEYLKKVKDEFNLKIDELKKEKTVKNTLELYLYTDSEKILALDPTEAEDWFIVSRVKEGKPGEAVAEFTIDDAAFYVGRAEEAKCPRCWKFKSVNEVSVCARCAEVV